MKWRLLPTISAPMSFQMALDEALFLRAKEDPSAPPMIRFYYSSEPWITTGCSFRDGGQADFSSGTGTFSSKKSQSQKICLSPSAARSELVRKNPEVPIAKRITGGGCVLHGNDLIFSLIVRLGQGAALERLGSARESYKNIHSCIAEALRSLGVDPRFYRASEELPKGDDCFSYPVENDLSWKGRKVAGGAQKRSDGVLLHHESIAVPQGVRAAVLITAIQNAFARVFEVKLEGSAFDAELYFNALKGSTAKNHGPQTTDHRPQ